MFKTQMLIKVGLFTFFYAMCYYFIPLPQLSFLGFLFPLAYLHADMEKVRYIQIQYMLGFCGGIVLSFVLIKLSLLSFFAGLISMSFIFCFCFYCSYFASWMKTPFVIFSAVTAMIFNILAGGDIAIVGDIFEKFILGIFLSVFIFALIDTVIGNSQYIYFPKGIYKNAHLNFLVLKWEPVHSTLCVYVAVLCVLSVQVLLGLSGAICAIATGSVVVVSGGMHDVTKTNILLRYCGALLGVVVAMVQLMLINQFPFFFMQVSMLIGVMLLLTYLVLTYQGAAKLAPQACVTYLTIVVAGIGNGAQLSDALLRVFGIILGVCIAYAVSVFFQLHRFKT